jgi:AcrR family transcriptional regulator
VSAAEETDLRAADGRVPGRRGRATRQRLLECTSEMLGSSSYRELKVIDIAREAGTSPATFYQYFPDVEAAILVLAEDMAKDVVTLSAVVTEGPWKGKDGYATALALADAFYAFWEEHRSVLRVVEVSTQEGDQRFNQIRSRMLVGVTDAMQDVFRQVQREGKHPASLDPRAVAGALVAMLANVASHQYGFEFWGIRTSDTREAMARQVYWGLTGQKPPA